MTSEAQARITINRLLEDAGWRFFPDGQGGRATVVCEHRLTRELFAVNQNLGKDFELAPNGFVDYVLLGEDRRAVAVLEAKRESIDPLTAKEQRRAYAERMRVSHIFLSNGLVHYYWNLHQGNPVRVSRFFPAEQLGKTAEWRPDFERLAACRIDENYIAVSQDASWLSYSPAERERVKVNQKIRLLRDYQLEAIRALQISASSSQHRFLFEMATGTGKTLLSAAIAKLYLRTQNADRILFLVDRLELENQAWRNFTAYLGPDGIQTVIFKERRRDWMQAQIVVTTIQSLAAGNRFLREFAPTDFQLLISDEAHRTINGNNRAIFDYFSGGKLGLTATPQDFLKGVTTEQRQDDPRELARRLLRDTYHTFGCDEGTPTFRYSLLDAVQHSPPYLCNPVTFDARTDITTQMLSDEGYLVGFPSTGDDTQEELSFGKRDYERKFFSGPTNHSFVNCFLDNAFRDPITDEIGKTIMFAVSRKHATKLVTLLNEEATRRWPEEYPCGSAFAVQITSDIPKAQQMTIQFANNNLNGKSRWRSEAFRDYDTSRTRVCVTVGMMTTGYDCEDLLNVVLARPIIWPTDFIQIKGRGTRLFTFKFGGVRSKQSAEKQGFGLFDFFANCEFFEKDFDYDKKLTLPKSSSEDEPGDDGSGGAGGVPRPDSYVNTSPDSIASVVETAVGLEGMRVDREMYRERFSRQVTQLADADTVLREAFEAEDWPAIEDRIQRLLFEKPEEFWNLPKLQNLFKSNRKPTLKEILSTIFGLIPAIPSRDQLAVSEFERFVATNETDATHGRELQLLFMAFLLDPVSRLLLQEERLADLKVRDATLFASVVRLAPDERKSLVEYLRTSVVLANFDQVS